MKVTPSEKILIQKILGKSLDRTNHTVFAFGSRVSGTPRPDSDLDLMLRAQTKTGAATLGQLKEDFENSDLPYKVDLVDEAVMSEDFRRKIAKDLEPVTF